LTDNFCAVREDAVVLATGAKALQLVADVARMQRRELAIDDFMIIAAIIVVLWLLCLQLLLHWCSLSALFSSKEATSSEPHKFKMGQFLLVGNWEPYQMEPSTSSPDSFRTHTMDALSFRLQGT
jgi:hypothetical protein